MPISFCPCCECNSGTERTLDFISASVLLIAIAQGTRGRPPDTHTANLNEPYMTAVLTVRHLDVPRSKGHDHNNFIRMNKRRGGGGVCV